MTNRAARFVALDCIAFTYASSAYAADLIVEKVTSDFPPKGLKVLGSGSGIVVGPRLILTNRHVATDEQGKPNAGFLLNLSNSHTPRLRWLVARADFRDGSRRS
jgi:hypothetical protein